MGARTTAVEMVAQAYDLSANLEAWFAGAVSLFRPHLEEGFGSFGILFAKKPTSFVHVHLDGAHPVNRKLMKLVSTFGLFNGTSEICAASTCSEAIGLATTKKLVAPFRGLISAADCAGVVGGDGAGLSLMITSPRRDPGLPRPSDHRLAQRVLPHFVTALRLRRTLTGLSLETPSAEAIFEPDGRCLNAQGMAQPESARDALRSEVVNLEKLRARPTEDDEPREALLAGRWSLVDRFDHHGRRYVVAYRNPPGVIDPRRLTLREREVAARLAQGLSQADTASELGVRPSTVASVAAGVVTKLGLRSTRELPLFWRDMAGYPVALGRSDVVALYCSAPDTPAPRLTPAEREVLGGVIRGQSNKDIAIYRETSTRTVANQVASLFAKFGVASRAELAARSLDVEDAGEP